MPVQIGGKVVVAVDPKIGNFEYYKGVDVITPNHHEAGVFVVLRLWIKTP